MEEVSLKDDCSSNPCRNGASCVDLYDDYFCQCNELYQGHDCEVDVDECSLFVNNGMGCKNGGKCVNLVGDFRCDCDPEYSGRFCESSYNDCLDDEFKCGHGLCVDGHRGQVGTPMFSCICEDGWATSNDDQTCNNDVNECQEKPCSKNPEVQCFNNPGSYTCGGCPTGYIGNGWACSDIDECSSNNGGCSQAPLVVCINTAGSNTCGPCPSGYTGDGRVCDVMNACEVNNGGCDVIATCTVNPAVGNIVTCTCPDGFLGNGVGVGGCVQGDTCADVCVNGQCQENQDKVEFCVCNIGWSGVNCDVNIDDCLTQPCNDGGTCIDGVGEYYCKCPNNYGGTNCEIDESGCGAYYVQDSGSFSFPAVIGQTYPSSSNCAWVVQVAAGKVIEATFPIFELEPHPDCVYDFLQIHDGSSASAHQIGKYCDTTVPGDPLTSTHNLLYFWFVSNAQNNYKGFQVVWQTGDPVCGESITHETYGDIKSPGYPGNYPPNRDCYWTIEVAAGFVVQLMFGTLALETHDNCTFDFLEIRNGLLETNLILARYCSSLSPPPLLSTAPGVWIYFHTDPYVSDAGFHITWSQQPVGISGCGGYHDDEDGVIISPNYPNLYLRNQECYYQIHIGVGGKILFIITNMDIEDHEECSWDYLELRDGSDENSLLVGRFCGQTTPPPFTSTTNDLWMKFRSDEAQGGSGFRATYTVACGGMYTAPNGQLQSPYYPLTYPANKDCFYEIRQEPGNFIMLMFDDVEIEEEADCNYDYIEVRDGSTTDAPLLSKICGTTIPAPIMSSHNYMWIHFASDAHTGGGGFHATYTTEYTGCGGLYTTPSGSIQSPDHPTPYPHGANCSYYISVHPTLLVNLRFLSFALEQPNDDGVCGDFVEVFDDQVSLGRYCGTTSPPDILSTSYKVTIFFSAGQTINNDGFAAAYSTVNATTACGGLVTANQGYITSPNYPSNYDDMRDCVWVVTVQTSLQIRVNFSDFSLESPNSEGVCDADYLEIRNGGYDDSALIGTYCGTSISSYFVTHGNQMFVKFSTNQKNNFRMVDMMTQH
uniref:cubilin-like n=1 Tax=Ciona intestinalis TaxID=7719 RepID=UPI000EF4F2F2|nr:cubilin-like [Ciona intestinalis]|eukprot:XP_026695897.1 cubilin-like [Ciona intestinalis]